MKTDNDKMSNEELLDPTKFTVKELVKITYKKVIEQGKDIEGIKESLNELKLEKKKLDLETELANTAKNLNVKKAIAIIGGLTTIIVTALEVIISYFFRH